MTLSEYTTIPESWLILRVADVGTVITGNTPLTKDTNNYGTDIPFVKPPELNDGRIDFAKSFLSEQGTKTARVIPPYSILVSCIGNLGKTGLNKIPVAFNQQINAIVPFKGIVSEYLFYQAQSHSFRSQLELKATATTISIVNKRNFETVELNIPPHPEQKRIVAKIEALFSELDNGIESLKTARDQLKIYRQALLKHAFSGKLTEQWRADRNRDNIPSRDVIPNNETAETLFQRIQSEREQRYQQQLKDWEAKGKQGNKPKAPKILPPLTAEELAELSELPKGWGWVKLSAISTSIQIGPFGSLLHKEDYVSNAIPLVNPSHIKNLKIVPDWNLTVNEQKLKELSNYILKANDIIIGRRGEMGRCAVIRNSEAGWLCGTGSLFVRLVPTLHADFYCHILSSKRVREYLSSSSIGTTMQNLNQEILHSVPVPLCGGLEQEEIFKHIEQQFSIIDQLDQTLATALQQAEALRQSILKKAFSGQLVPQDPNDEPASVLLERIQAEKVKSNTLAPGSRGKKQ